MNKYIKLTIVSFVMGSIISILSLSSTITNLIEKLFPVGYISCMLFSIGIVSFVIAIIEKMKNKIK